jgi:hypothetical protein
MPSKRSSDQRLAVRSKSSFFAINFQKHAYRVGNICTTKS